MTVAQWSTTASLNVLSSGTVGTGGINIDEGMARSDVNNAMRDIMAQIAAWRAAATFSGTLTPASNDGAALGTGALSFSDLFLASGGVINWNNGDVLATHSANLLAFSGASSGYTFDAAVKPGSNDGAALGVSGTAWSDAFFATGAVVDFGASNYTLTHSSGTLTASGALTVSGAFTSLGIDDNATGERLQIADTGINFGPSSTADYSLGRVLDTGSLSIGGSAVAATSGGAILTLWGASHATQAGDILLTTNGAGGSPGLTLDISATLLTLAAGGGNVYMPDTTRFGQNTTSTPGAGNNTAGISLRSDGTMFASSATAHTLNISADGAIVNLRSGGTTQGAISVSGSTVTYGTFNGSHEAQLADGVDRSRLLCGTIIDSVDEQCNWYGYPDRVLPKVKISDKPGSKRVYGVFFDWYNSDPKDDTANNSALGAYVIRIAAGEIVEGGDLIESNGDGCGRVQADDIFRASTVAKITSTVVADTYPDGSYLLPCTLHCG